MLRTLIVLPDGRELFSGSEGTAVMDCTLTQAVNSEEELTLGSVCAAMLEVTVFSPEDPGLAAGQALTAYKVTDNGSRRRIGIFISEKPQRTSANTWSVTAYDRISLLDQDVTDWLAALSDWPYRLRELADLVCRQCGLELEAGELPNGDYEVPQFSAQGITGRQLMQWIGQAAGRFCRATPEGKAAFGWYTPTALRIGPAAGPVTVTDDGAGAVGISPVELERTGGDVHITAEDLAVSCQDGTVALTTLPLRICQGELTAADYAVEPIAKVRLRQTEEDVGVVWPDTGQGNTYTITGNYLLTAATREQLLPIAHSLYDLLRGVRYTPCTVTVPSSLDIAPGQILTVTDREGREHTVYVMTRVQSGQRDTLECTGSQSRGSSSAVNYQSYQALSGKVLEIRSDVEGLRVDARNASGRMAQFQVDVDGIRLRVSGAEQEVADIRENGVSKVKMDMGYRFDEEGLTIHREGEQMENLLDNTGMYVRRAGETILRADQQGVEAVDVTVRNYLEVGDHARFEDYGTDRTACFWEE